MSERCPKCERGSMRGPHYAEYVGIGCLQQNNEIIHETIKRIPPKPKSNAEIADDCFNDKGKGWVVKLLDHVDLKIAALEERLRGNEKILCAGDYERRKG